MFSFKNLKERAEQEYMSHAEQDKEGFLCRIFTLGSASRYSQNQTLEKEVKECKKEREREVLHQYITPFVFSLCQILKVQKNPKMKIEVNLKLYKDKLLIRGKIIETLLVVVVVEIYYKA